MNDLVEDSNIVHLLRDIAPDRRHTSASNRASRISQVSGARAWRGGLGRKEPGHK